MQYESCTRCQLGAAVREEVSPLPVRIDMEGVSSGWKPIPGGVYNAEVQSAQMTKSGSGNPMITIDYTPDEYPKERIRGFYSLAPNALWKLKQDLTGLGIEVP